MKEAAAEGKRVARLTRSEQRKAKDQALDAIIRQQEEEEKGAEDPGLDLFEPVDILAKYGPEWQDKMTELKAWAEKKKELDALYEDCAQPKIKPGDFSGIVSLLKKLITDSMVAVSHSAIKVCGNLAKGLKKDFEVGAKELTATLLLRFKEKKTQIVDDSHLSLEQFILCANIEGLKEQLIGVGLSDKAPSVKKNTCLFLEKLVQKTYIDVLQRVSGEFLGQLAKLSEDPDSEVRNAVLSLLGIFKGRLGEGALSNI